MLELDLPRPEELEPHPIALLFPDCSPEENRELARNIKANGLRQDIWLYEDTINGGPKKPYILDGRRRNAACVVEQVRPRYQVYTGDDPLGFVADLNYHRRNLTFADRKRLAAELFKANPAQTDNAVATKTGISPHTAKTVRKEAEAETPPANLQNANKDAGEGHLRGDYADDREDPKEVGYPREVPPKPAERVERGLKKDGTPRQARGRKPGPKVAEADAPKKAIKPKPVLGNPRDQWVATSSAIFSGNVSEAIHAVVAIVRNHANQIRERVPESQRKALLEQFAEALGLKIVS